jgi:hypothetical protein
MSVPPGSNVANLTGADTATPSFTPDRPGVYVAGLIVNDGKVDSVPVATTITVESFNNVPKANPGSNQTVVLGATVNLSGLLSSDPDVGDRLTYLWTITSRPSSSSENVAKLSDATSPTPTFKPDALGIYVLTLVVNDGRASSPVATVAVTAVSSATGLSGGS